uniref:N-end aminoacyl transferase N-terminal domain-containing protein n=1 Tax=Acrobeloides nanus TaxID=290746 RepID=A0A914BUP7_9BILA
MGKIFYKYFYTTWQKRHPTPRAVNGQQMNPKRASTSPSISPNVKVAKFSQDQQKGKKRKQLRKERKLSKLAQNGVDINKYQEERKMKEKMREKKIEDRLKQCMEFQEGVNKHKLETRLVAINSLEFYETVIESFFVYKKYQEKIHKLIDWINTFLDYAETPFENVDRGGGNIYGTYHLQV